MVAKRLFAFVVVVASLSTANAFAQHRRTIYYNGKVFTSSPLKLWAEGVVVEGKSIVTVGSTVQVLRAKEADSNLVDLRGRTMIPGLNDAHVHPFDTTSFPRSAHLNVATDFIPGPGPTLPEVVELIRQGTARNPPGTWLFVSVGVNVVEDPNANRFALDAVSPDHPVLLAAWYGHGTFLNTKALRTIGIGDEEPDPFGGFYERLPGSNVINGVAHEYAEHQIRAYFAAQMTDQEFKTLYEAFAAAAAERGYTSVQDISVGLPQRRHVDILARANIRIRWRAICFPLDLDDSCEAGSPRPGKPLTIANSGIKWIADATMVERGAFLTEDYADAPGVRGRLNFPPAAIELELRRSASGPAVQAQPLFHSVGDGTSDTIVDQMGAVATDEQWKVRRPRIEHGTLLRPSRYDSARRKGIFVVQNPVHFSLAPIVNVRFSAGLLADVDPMKSLLKAGVKVALGSDSVIAPGNPFLDLFFARIQPTRPSEALSIEEAVIAYTRTAAEAEFQEGVKGTIEPGKLADLVVLSQDIFTIPPDALPGTQAVLTVVNGEVVHDAGVL